MCKLLPRFYNSRLVDLDFHVLNELHVAFEADAKKLVVQIVEVLRLACILPCVVLEDLS
jgi:hypothetical protein